MGPNSNLPLQSWDRDIISSIANEIGKLIAIDSATLNRTRLIHARFCVLLRVDKPTPVKVELDMEGGKWTQDLVYETLGIRCYKCRQGGHLPQNCDLQKQAPGEGAKEIEDKDQREEEDQAKSTRENKEKEAGEETNDSQEDKENKTEQGDEEEDTLEQQTKGESSNKEDQEESSSEAEDSKDEQEEQSSEGEDSQEDKEDDIQDSKGNKTEQEKQEQSQGELQEYEKPRYQKKVVVQFDDEDREQEQGQRKRQEAGKQGEETVEHQEGKEPEEVDEGWILWQKKQQKKERRREKRRQENEEAVRVLFAHRYHFRNRYYNGRYGVGTQDTGARPGRPSNQVMRERESQAAIEQGKQKTLD